MNDSLPDRASVESMLLGSLTLSLEGDETVWNEDNRGQKISDVISEVKKEVLETIPGAAILRLVRVPADFQTEVIRWQRQLNKREGITSGVYGEAHGKAIVWGTGEINATYGIIILSPIITLGYLLDEENFGSLFKGVFCHELAHIHEDFVYLHIHGEPHSERYEGWDDLRNRIAYTAWSEFFAEFFAYRFFKNWDIETQVLEPTSTLRTARNMMMQEIRNYRISGNLDHLWQNAQESTSQVFSQISKSAGLIIAGRSDNNKLEQILTNECLQFGSDWVVLIEDIINEYEIIIDKYNVLTSPIRLEIDFSNLARLYERLMNLVGLFPRNQGDGIWIDVP